MKSDGIVNFFPFYSHLIIQNDFLLVYSEAQGSFSE
ncbi:hypothetical protein ES708_09575 [subsurface metagenome]